MRTRSVNPPKTHGLSRRELLKAGLAEWSLPIEQLGEGAKFYRYDPKEAKRLLAEAGYPKGFKTHRTVTGWLSGDLIDDAQLVQRFLKDVGIEAELKIQEHGAYMAPTMNLADQRYSGGRRSLHLVPVLFPLACGEASLANLKSGDSVLVMGAAGGLSSCLVQVARTCGAHVIAATGADGRWQANHAAPRGCGRAPSRGDEHIRGQNRPGPYPGVDDEQVIVCRARRHYSYGHCRWSGDHRGASQATSALRILQPAVHAANPLV